MSKILVIKSAITGENSYSNKYVAEVVGKVKKSGDIVIVRDLARIDVGTLQNEHLIALSEPTSAVSKKFDAIINELKDSDIIVIGAPMYNFNISGLLKNYLDAVTLANKTFKYNNEGVPEGLIKGKKAYIVSTRGGAHKEEGRTFQEDYLKCHLGFIGITDVTFIFIEGIATGKTEKELNDQFLSQI